MRVWRHSGALLSAAVGVPVGLALGRFDVPEADPFDAADDREPRP